MWYRWVPSLTGGATLWVVIAVILMAVYFRRRQQARSVRTRWEREEAEQRAKLEEWMWQHWDPSSIPRPSDDRSSIDHDGNTYTLH